MTHEKSHNEINSCEFQLKNIVYYSGKDFFEQKIKDILNFFFLKALKSIKAF